MTTSDLHSQHRRGLLFIVSAPSGAGKTTLVRRLTATLDNINVSVSHTTRPRREREVEGVDYFFIDEERFQSMVKADRFIENARVFDHHYGTEQATLESTLNNGHDVILEIDWQGAQQIRRRIPGTISIFIAPPSYDSLTQRLRDRGREDEQTIARRMDEAVDELSHYHEYDYLIINDDLEQAVADLTTIVTAARLNSDCRRPALDGFVQGLIAQARQIQ